MVLCGRQGGSNCWSGETAGMEPSDCKHQAMYKCLHTCPHAHLSTCLYTYLYTCLHKSAHMSGRMSAHMSAHISTHMSMHVCTLSAPALFHMSTRMSRHMSIHRDCQHSSETAKLNEQSVIRRVWVEHGTLSHSSHLGAVPTANAEGLRRIEV